PAIAGTIASSPGFASGCGGGIVLPRGLSRGLRLFRLGYKEGVMKAIAIGLLAVASISLAAPANAHIWVHAKCCNPGWGVGDYWHYDRGYIGPTANNYWRYYRIPCQVVRDGPGRWWVTRCM